MQPRIIPKKIAFTEFCIEKEVLLKAYSLYNSPKDYIPLEYKSIEKFLENNGVPDKKLLVKVLDTPIFITITVGKNYGVVQTYIREQGINKILHTASLEYPNINNEKYDNDFFNSNWTNIVYGFLNSLGKYATVWNLKK